jgi:copper(I)-binding protein
MCPFQAISFLSLHASFPSYFDLVEKKTMVTKYATTVNEYRESDSVNAQNSRHCHICELHETSFVQKL